MADKTIGSLPQATTVDDSSLFVCEQQGVAMKTTGAQWKGFAVQAVSQYVEPAQQAAQQAQQAATNAKQSEENAAQSATGAADSAQTAQEYSGKPPIIQNDTWWTWNAETGQYEDTGQSAKGDVMFATFAIDPETGLLTMITPDGYDGPTFMIVNGFLEVNINA